MEYCSYYTHTYKKGKYENTIKIYTGDTELSEQIHRININLYEKENKKYLPMFTSLEPSTFTVNGNFDNIVFNESEIIDFLSITPGSPVLKIGCNFGEVYNTAPPPKSIREKKEKSNRGRKPRMKVSTRKKQGTGKYFSSQITFEIYNEKCNKIYKIKLFRNGRFQIPGVSRLDMEDIIDPVYALRECLVENFGDRLIRPTHLISVMRNYKCKLRDEKLLVCLEKLETVFNREKNSATWKSQLHGIFKELFPGDEANMMIFAGRKCGIAEILHNNERCPGLVIKLNTIMPATTDKKTTLKILKSGKINFDGCNSQLEAVELYQWLTQVYRENAKFIMFNLEDIERSITPSEGESIYDDELPEPLIKEKFDAPKEIVIADYELYRNE